MKLVRDARIVVVADSDQALLVAARLGRMELGEVAIVAGLTEARQLCRGGDIDACVVALDDALPDQRQTLLGDAPGRGCSVPALMIVPVVSPDLRRQARCAGYAAIVPASIAPRLLYRRIRALLQGRRTPGRGRRRSPSAIVVPPLTPARGALTGKPTLH